MENGAGFADMRAGLEFQQRLAGMSEENLITAFDEIDRLDLSSEERQALESMLLDSLIKVDPEYALNRFSDKITSDSSGVGWQLSSALRDWAKTDLAGATAWFDRQIADGNFESKTLDGKSEMRTQFEGALMESLLATDFEAASRRLATIPEDQRREVLEQIPFSELSSEVQQAYATLVRELIPQDERAGSFAHIAAQLVNESGYDEVTAFLDAVHATPAERASSAQQTAESRMELLGREGEVTRQDVDHLRQWLSLQAPEKTDTITGKALAEAAQDDGKFKFAEASQLVLQYQQSSGNDDVLVAFLQSYAARSNLEQAQSLANKIMDDKLRAEILKQLE